MAEYYGKGERLARAVIIGGLIILMGSFAGAGAISLLADLSERREQREVFEIDCERKYAGKPKTQKYCVDRAMSEWVRNGGK